MKKEIDYLNYRDNYDSPEKWNILHSNEAILVIYPTGEMEEISVEGKYHFEELYKKFSYVSGVDENDEFLTSIRLAQVGYIIILADLYGICAFFPGRLEKVQKDKVLEVLCTIKKDYTIFAGKVCSLNKLDMEYFNDGDVIEVGDLIDKVNQISLVDEESIKR